MELFEGEEQRNFGKGGMKASLKYMGKAHKNHKGAAKMQSSKHRPDAGAALRVHGNGVWLFTKTMGPYTLTPREPKQLKRCSA